MTANSLFRRSLHLNTSGKRRLGSRGVAALEFSLAAPALMLMVGVVADYSLLFWKQGVLASSVAQGAQFAVLKGANVLASDIRIVVQKTLSLPTSAVIVEGPGCYCLVRVPLTASPATCGQTCSDGSLPGTYVKVSASYSYTPSLPSTSTLGTTVLSEAAWVRLK